MTMSLDSMKSVTVFYQIDEGNFGQIWLVRKNGGIDNGKTYAMKTIQSDPTIENQHKICLNELKVMKIVWGIPFFVQLKYAVKDRHHYHLIMDYMPGGNLFNFLQSNGKFTLAETTICCAEIVQAIEYLHDHRIVYRDLKLENILIASDKHIVLTDFGLARNIQNDERLTDEAGTVAYFAPEILDTNKGHSFEVDWWSLGIIAFELLIGHTPFVSSTTEAISDRMLRTRIEREQPRLAKLRKVHQNVDKITNFIQNLLIKDPEQRLGAGQTGFQAVKKHPFFSQLNWTAVKLKVYKCIDRNAPARNIEIDFDHQYTVSLAEPQELRRKQFYYVAPELQRPHHSDSFHGFTENDLNDFPQKMSMPSPTYDNQLRPDLLIRTTTPAETIKRIVMPKKVVKSSGIAERTPENANSTKTQEQGNSHRFSPYPGDIDTPRRSERVASKRAKRCSSFV